MTHIRHHLTDDLLLAYSAGALPEAFNLVVATHVSLCDECRSALEACDALGGAILEDCDAVELSEDSLARTLALIADGDRDEQAPREIRLSREIATGAFPTPLQDYAGTDVKDVRWKRVGGGVSQAILKTSSDATVRLLKIPGGVAIPDHGHGGTELTLVLKGAFRDEFDRFGPGDIEVANEDVQHTPVAEDGEDCICLAATDAPLRFTGLIPRIAQRFVRI